MRESDLNRAGGWSNSLKLGYAIIERNFPNGVYLHGQSLRNYLSHVRKLNDLKRRYIEAEGPHAIRNIIFMEFERMDKLYEDLIEKPCLEVFGYTDEFQVFRTKAIKAILGINVSEEEDDDTA